MPGMGGQDDRNGGSACSGIYNIVHPLKTDLSRHVINRLML
jgi:hypothetical protein